MVLQKISWSLWTAHPPLYHELGAKFANHHPINRDQTVVSNFEKKVSTFSFSLPKTVFIQFGTRRQQFLAKNLDQSETQAKQSMERMTGFEILSFPLVQELAEAFKI